MRNQNSESADVKVVLEGQRLAFVESRRRRQTKIPPRVEVIRQIIDEAIESEGKVHKTRPRSICTTGFMRYEAERTTPAL